MYEVAITGLTQEQAEQFNSQLVMLAQILPPDSGIKVVVRETRTTTVDQTFPDSQPYCIHPAYSDGHCADMTCHNYVQKCPRHSGWSSGRKNAPCSNDAE